MAVSLELFARQLIKYRNNGKIAAVFNIYKIPGINTDLFSQCPTGQSQCITRFFDAAPCVSRPGYFVSFAIAFHPFTLNYVMYSSKESGKKRGTISVPYDRASFGYGLHASQEPSGQS